MKTPSVTHARSNGHHAGTLTSRHVLVRSCQAAVGDRCCGHRQSRRDPPIDDTRLHQRQRRPDKHAALHRAIGPCQSRRAGLGRHRSHVHPTVFLGWPLPNESKYRRPVPHPEVSVGVWAFRVAVHFKRFGWMCTETFPWRGIRPQVTMSFCPFRHLDSGQAQ